jgi:hypothetical protein
MSWDIELDDQLLQDLYAWIDQIPLSRPKKRIEKDFSDGGKSIIFHFISPISLFYMNIRINILFFILVMVAELIKYYFPSWVKYNFQIFHINFYVNRWIYIIMHQQIIHNKN